MNKILITSPNSLGFVLLLATLGQPGQHLAAQKPPVHELTLPNLQRAAAEADNHARIPELLQRQSDLQQRSIASERLPRLAFQASAQHLSDVTSFAATNSGGAAFPVPQKDQYDAAMTAQIPMMDPTIGSRAAEALASNDVEQARIQSTLWQRRQLVNNAFFAIVRLDDELAALAAARADLKERHDVASRRVAQGQALPSEELLVQAELLKLADSRDAALANRAAQFKILELLTGVSIATDAPVRLILPDLSAQVSAARQDLGDNQSRPEYREFAASRHLIDARSNAAAAATKPRLSAFARGGYGRPGLNQLSRQSDTYYRVGVQVEWSPWNWGTTNRLRSELGIQSQVVQSNEAAFTEQLQRVAAANLAAIDHLAQGLTTDDSLVALRATILDEARQRFDEGVITAAQYVDRETDLTQARLRKARHHAQLGELRATLLTTLGLEVR